MKLCLLKLPVMFQLVPSAECFMETLSGLRITSPQNKRSNFNVTLYEN